MLAKLGGSIKSRSAKLSSKLSGKLSGERDGLAGAGDVRLTLAPKHTLVGGVALGDEPNAPRPAMQPDISEAAAEIARLRQRVRELEAASAPPSIAPPLPMQQAAPSASPAAAPAPAIAAASREWGVTAWLASLGLHMLVARCIEPPVGTDAFEYAKTLTKAAVLEKLRATDLYEDIAAAVERAAVQLQQQRARSGKELSDKFEEEAFKGPLKYASLSTFFGGLSALIGDPRIVEGSLFKV
jgi:hypothetical protein